VLHLLKGNGNGNGNGDGDGYKLDNPTLAMLRHVFSTTIKEATMCCTY